MRSLPLCVAVVLAACGGGDGGGSPAPTATAPAGRAIFAEQGCGSCHAFAAAASSGEVGPNLDDALAGETRTRIIDSIVNPGAGSMMPGDFGTRMSPAEIDALADFLVAERRR